MRFLAIGYPLEGMISQISHLNQLSSFWGTLQTYHEELDGSSHPVNGDFEVAVDSEARSVSMVAMSSDEVVLTLESAVTSGQTVTLNYTQGTNPIRDLAQNPAIALSNRSVTNLTGGI